MNLDSYIERLEAITSFLRSNRTIIEECVFDVYTSTLFAAEVELSFAGDDAAKNMSRARKALGGKWEKNASGFSFTLEREIDGVEVTLSANRERVCTKKVVGVEEVTIPATEERKETREVVEWDCGAILPASLEAVKE